MQTRIKNRTVSMRLSPIGDDLLEQLARMQGISKTAVMEIAIRDTAKSKGIPIPEQQRSRVEYDDNWTDDDLKAATETSLQLAEERFGTETGYGNI